MFIGRQKEILSLQKKYQLNKAQLIVIYGRRRIGKSELIRHFCKKKAHLIFEGIENQPQKVQIQNILDMLANQIKNPFVSKLALNQWNEIFLLLTEEIDKSKEKLVLVFDEFQWMANLRSPLVSLFKLYWDNHWKNKNVMIILCGSVATFMVKKVIHSKALYGRINLELCLQGLNPIEARKLMNKRGTWEVLRYLLILGTVPKYLEEIDQNQSLNNNLNQLCFSKNGFFVNELEKVFFSQFREAQTYKKIVTILSTGNFTLGELSTKIKISSGGGLKSYLSNLELSGFVRSYTSIHSKGHRNQKYKLFDEFLVFYFKYILPHHKQILQNSNQQLFNLLVEPQWQTWLGIAFETFCLKHAMIIAEAAGFANEVTAFAPFFASKDKKFQIDLIYKRSQNVITVAEIKYHADAVGTSIVPEMENKLSLLKLGKKCTIERMLIAPMGADKHLLATGYFHHVIDMKTLFNSV